MLVHMGWGCNLDGDLQEGNVVNTNQSQPLTWDPHLNQQFPKTRNQDTCRPFAWWLAILAYHDLEESDAEFTSV